VGWWEVKDMGFARSSRRLATVAFPERFGRVPRFGATFPHLFLVPLHKGESFLGCPYDGHGGSLFDSTEGVVQLGLGYPERRRGGGVRTLVVLFPDSQDIVPDNEDCLDL
jgi:hypothetical protein